MAKKKNNQMSAFIMVDGVEYELCDIDKSETGRIVHDRFSIKELYELYKKNAIIRDILMQRTENQWVRLQKCELIMSVICERDISKILMTGKGLTDDQLYEKRSLLDGLQRLSTLCGFIDNDFALSKRMKPIPFRFKSKDGVYITRNIDLSGLKFNQFPTLIQQRILDHRVDVDIYNGYTDEELDKVVFCVNNGTRFKPMQKLRTVLKSCVMKYLQPVCDSTLWEEVKNCKDINDTILGCVVRSLMLYTGYDYKQLSVSEMTKFSEDFSQKRDKTIADTVSGLNCLVEQLANIVCNLSDEENEKLLTACNIPHLIMNLDKFNCYDGGKEPTDYDYADFLHKFLKSADFVKYCSYCRKTGSGGVMYSAKNTDERQRIIDEALDNYMIENEFIGGTSHVTDSTENTNEGTDSELFIEEICEENYESGNSNNECTDGENEEYEEDEFNTFDKTGHFQSDFNSNDTGEFEGISPDRLEEDIEDDESYGILSEDTRAS